MSGDRDVAQLQDAEVPNLRKNLNDPILQALGNEIRRLRMERRTTQISLAFVAGEDRSYLGYIEGGANNVAFLTLKKLAEALGASVSELTATPSSSNSPRRMAVSRVRDIGGHPRTPPFYRTQFC